MFTNVFAYIFSIQCYFTVQIYDMEHMHCNIVYLFTLQDLELECYYTIYRL